MTGINRKTIYSFTCGRLGRRPILVPVQRGKTGRGSLYSVEQLLFFKIIQSHRYSLRLEQQKRILKELYAGADVFNVKIGWGWYQFDIKKMKEEVQIKWTA